MAENFQSSKFSFQKPVSETTSFWMSLLGGVLIILIISLIVFLLLPKVKVELKIIGPEKVKAGEEVKFTVLLKNKGNVFLEKGELSFQYPKGALSEKAPLETIKLERGLIPKEEIRFEFKMVPLGKEGEVLEVKSWFNFSPKGKDEIRQKTASLSFSISQVPVALILNVPEKVEIVPQRPSSFSFQIKYFSSLSSTISNLKIKVDMPSSFTFQESDPFSEKLEFEIEKLEPEQKGEIVIFGSVKEREGQPFPVRAKLIAKVRGEDILLKEEQKQATTFIPNFFVYQTINGEENFIPSPGQRLHFRIFYKNLKREPALNLDLVVILEGNLFDLESIEARGGKFQKGDNTISWSGETIPSLKYLIPDEEGSVDFWVKLKQDFVPKSKEDFNQKITTRVLIGGFEKSFTTKVNSLVKFAQEGYYYDRYRMFENTGPHPPRAGTPTTYTIIWKISNYYNQLNDVKVSAYLPRQIRIKTQKVGSGTLKIIGSEEKVSRYPEIPPDFVFTSPIYYGVRSRDVYYLQIILRDEVPSVYTQKTPITGYFGKTTLEAVRRFQIKYRDEILTPQGLKEAPGYVDSATIKKLNELLARGIPGGETQVVWEVSRVPAGTGALTSPLMIAFQIEFIPEIKQKGLVATLIKEATLAGIDQWTNSLVYSKDDAIDTTLPDDRNVDHSFGQVR
jgi:peptidoglycan hydrolase-like protein with peptidoglycan-binding domain